MSGVPVCFPRIREHITGDIFYYLTIFLGLWRPLRAGLPITVFWFYAGVCVPSQWRAICASGFAGYPASGIPQTLAQDGGRSLQTISTAPRLRLALFLLAMVSVYEKLEKRIEMETERRKQLRPRAGHTSRTLGEEVWAAPSGSTASMGLPSSLPPSSALAEDAVEPLELDAKARALFRARKAEKDLDRPG